MRIKLERALMLSDILNALNVTVTNAQSDAEITHITTSSKECFKGDLFVALVLLRVLHSEPRRSATMPKLLPSSRSTKILIFSRAIPMCTVSTASDVSIQLVRSTVKSERSSTEKR